MNRNLKPTPKCTLTPIQGKTKRKRVRSWKKSKTHDSPLFDTSNCQAELVYSQTKKNGAVAGSKYQIRKGPQVLEANQLKSKPGKTKLNS